MPTNEPAVLPSKHARAALDHATNQIMKLQKSASRNVRGIGRRLAQIADLELHRARGFTSIEHYAE